MRLEDLTSFQLLVLNVLLRVVESDVCHTLASLSDVLLEHEVVCSRLHVVSVSLNESLHLLVIKVIAVFIL